MVRAWFMDTSDDDQRLPHMTSPPEMVSVEELIKKCGANYWKLDTGNYETDGKLSAIRKDLHLDFEDKITCQKGVENYDEMIKKFFVEHLHPDNETRFVTDGSGYFDIREPTTDRWIRIEVEKGDMLDIPAGAYHRFTLDSKDYIKANRYFSGVPVWTPFNRPHDDHPSRIAYLKEMGLSK